MCNALKRKTPTDQRSAKMWKKPRKAEVNYLPPYPAGQDEESQEQERIQLLTEVGKRDNNKSIKEKMSKTFAHRRNKIINQSPTIEDITARWPALFEASNVSYKWIIIRNIPLQLWGVNYFIQNVLSCSHLLHKSCFQVFPRLNMVYRFHRITTVHLESRFISKLDEYFPRLLNLFHSKGRAMGLRLRIK